MRVITFSTYYPKGHPKAGYKTFFVEKIQKALDLGKTDGMKNIISPELVSKFNFSVFSDCEPKYHTIRSGHRWKVGDQFSPRIWSGKPYASKQIQFAPPIEIKKIWKIVYEHANGKWWIDGNCYYAIHTLAANDGLTEADFINWFNIHPKAKKEGFKGQILCWNENIEY